jgi:hypothetical protein
MLSKLFYIDTILLKWYAGKTVVDSSIIIISDDGDSGLLEHSW